MYAMGQIKRDSGDHRPNQEKNPKGIPDNTDGDTSVKDPKGIPDNTDGDTSVKDQNSLRELIADFSQRTTFHGISYLTDPNIIVRGFWSFIVIGALVASGYFGFLVIKDYFTWPYLTTIDLVTRPNLEFPAVTICNMNRLRRSQLPGTRFEGLIDIDGGISFDTDDDYEWFFDWDDEWTTWWDDNYGSHAGPSAESPEGPSVEESPEGPFAGPSEESPEGPSAESPEGPSVEESPAEQSEGPFAGPSAGSSAESSAVPPEDPVKRKRREIPQNKRLINYKTQLQQKKKVNHHIRKRQAEYQEESYQHAESYDKLYELYDRFDFSDDYVDSVANTYDRFEFYNYWGNVSEQDDWRGLYKHSKADDFSDIINVANPSKEELKDLGHQAEDFILQCTFDKRACNHTHFKVTQNKDYGNCFAFNHGTGGEKVRSTSKSGAQFGLHLTLFIEQPEYIGLFSPESGVRLSIHDRKQKPFPEDDGLTAAPGFATSIGVKQISISRLSLPYVDCQIDELDQGDGEKSEYKYSTRECSKICLQKELLDKCQCVTDILLNSPQCSALNKTQELCRQFIDDVYAAGILECSCPTACDEVTYTTSTSSSEWPSERYEEHFKQRLEEDEVDAARLLDNVEQTRKNFVRLRVYFEELNYQEISQTPKYTIESITGIVGGLTGFYIGASVLTIVEFLVLVFSIIKLVFKKIFNFGQVYPTVD